MITQIKGNRSWNCSMVS